MPRVTKAMLEEDVKSLLQENRFLKNKNSRLEEVNELLKQKQFDVDAFCRMHGEAITAIAHTVADLRAVIQRLH